MAIDLVLDGAETAAQPTALAPEVTTESVLAEVEQLTPEEQKQIEQFAGKIDIHKSEIVMNYGATIQKQSASIATKTLQDVKTKNTGEVSSLLIEMVGAMNGLSGGEDKGGFIQRFMQKVKGKALTVRTRNESAEKTLERIEKQLEGHKLVLQKDIAMLDDLYNENWETFKALTLYIKAAELALNKARNEELPALYAKAQETGLPEDAMKADEFAKQCDQFDKQVHNLRLTRTNCLQSAPQIKMIQHNDMDMAMKLQSSIVNTMPLWRKKIAMSIALNNNMQAVAASNAVDDLTNKMLREQAEQFHLSVVESAKASQRSIIDIETIDYVNKEVTGAVLDYIAIEQQGQKDRQNAVAVIARSEQELVQGVLSATAQRRS
ncbi:MAG: toxic anion resistance protein [Ruminococcus sp.]|nr:toxic anion resistance protein [Ruminococcus sp.]MBQ1814606.1 toxic anion resistance protein [Ruminococcus sp.]MBQ2570610.1 toxic anion resistance protein [Ruminococcus sp.]MBQ4179710.1 toxic anion resistance protein [Ruminococcus sp.]